MGVRPFIKGFYDIESPAGDDENKASGQPPAGNPKELNEYDLKKQSKFGVTGPEKGAGKREKLPTAANSLVG